MQHFCLDGHRSHQPRKPNDGGDAIVIERTLGSSVAEAERFVFMREMTTTIGTRLPHRSAIVPYHADGQNGPHLVHLDSYKQTDSHADLD